MTDLENERWNTSAKPRTRKTKAASDDKPKRTRRTKKQVQKSKQNAKQNAKAKETRASEKEKLVAATEKKLAPFAKEVNYKLTKADETQDKADDYRLSAALKLAEAKKIAQEAGVPFKHWAEKNITTHTFETVRKLALIGESENPAEALKETREKNKTANKALRDQRKSDPKSSRKLSKPENDVDVALNAIDRIPDEQRKKLLESVANNEGLAVVPKAEATATRASVAEDGTVDAAKVAFLALTKVQRKAFVDWAQEKITADAAADAAVAGGEIPELPADLNRRKRKTAPASDDKPKRTRRTRKTAPAA